MDFKTHYGTWALITGASSGIGKEFAYQLAARGLNVVLVARRKDLLRQHADEIKNKYHVKVRILLADLTEPDAVKFIDEATQDLEIGLLVNSAGREIHGAFVNSDLEDAHRLTQLNVTASMLLALHFGQKMRERKRGGILFLASLIGHMSAPYMAHYAATKAYILTLGESLYYEMKKHNIDVIAVCPGLTATEMTQNMRQKGMMTSKQPKMMTTHAVVFDALKKLGKRPSTIPGKANYLMAFICRKIMSRRVTAYMFGKAMSKVMAKKLLG